MKIEQCNYYILRAINLDYRMSSSRQRLNSVRNKKINVLSGLIRARINRFDSDHDPFLRDTRTLPKFQKAYSQSRLSQSNQMHKMKKVIQKTNNSIYNKLSNQLKQIKETLKQSLVNISHPTKKRSAKRRQKVITQISEPQNNYKRKRSEDKNKSNRNYYDVLKHIQQIKGRNKLLKTQDSVPVKKSIDEQKTLFYGVDYISSIEFKIKIKLSQTTYYLFAKNNHTKVMVQMSYQDYMRLHLGELKGNPCNIFHYLYIENNKIKLKLKNSSQKKTPSSLKTYLGYY